MGLTELRAISRVWLWSQACYEITKYASLLGYGFWRSRWAASTAAPCVATHCTAPIGEQVTHVPASPAASKPPRASSRSFRRPSPAFPTIWI